MSASNAMENAILELLFKNTNYANVGDATGLRGSSTAGVFWIALHTSDPGETGAQNTNEANYTGYARKSIVRSGSGFSVSGDTVSNVDPLTFDACSAGSNTITHFSIGTDQTGAGTLLLSGALNASLAVSAGITPSFAAGALQATAA